MRNPSNILYFLASNRFPALTPESRLRRCIDGIEYELGLTENIDRHLSQAG